MRAQLDWFLHLYEAGSISRAAARMHLSQPALSKHLARLEDELEVRLFERTPAGLRPTAYATALARHARVIGAEIDLARSEIAHLREAFTGHVVFGASPTIAAGVLPAASQDLLRLRPGLHFTLTEAAPAALVQAVRSGELEFAICTAPLDRAEDEVVFEDLFEDRYGLVVASGHALLHRPRLELPELFEFPWVLVPHRSTMRDRLEAAFKQAGLPPPVPQVETTSIAHAIATVELGNFITLTALPIVQPQIADGLLRQIMAERLSFSRSVALAYRQRHPPSPGARLIVAQIIEAARARGLPTRGP